MTPDLSGPALPGSALPEGDKLRAMAELAAGAGHEVNNPLAAIAGRASLLLSKETNPDSRRALATIVSEAHRARDMIGDLMLFARPPEPAPEFVDASAPVEDVLNEFTAQNRDQLLTVTGARGDATAWADPTQFRIVVAELVRNAVRFSPTEAEIDVSVVGRAEGVILSVADCGPGLSDLEREHLFDPFYSGRQAGRGLGFGLAKCWRIVTSHGGAIRVEFTDRTVFVVEWPAGPDGR